MRTRVPVLVAALSFSWVIGASAQTDDVSITPHNLSPSGAFTYQNTLVADNDQICVYCHTPHLGTTDAPLWNRAIPAGPYTMYDSPTIDMTIAASPQGVSLACLSCHDGTVAFDRLYNAPTMAMGAYDYDAAATARGWTFAGGANAIPAGVVTNLTTDLSDDHPVSITYDNTAAGDTAFNGIVAGAVGGLPLYGAGANQVECGSCHNPHNDTNVPFLRATNAASALCLTCHIK